MVYTFIQVAKNWYRWPKISQSPHYEFRLSIQNWMHHPLWVWRWCFTILSIGVRMKLVEPSAAEIQPKIWNIADSWQLTLLAIDSRAWISTLDTIIWVYIGSNWESVYIGLVISGLCTGHTASYNLHLTVRFENYLHELVESFLNLLSHMRK